MLKALRADGAPVDLFDNLGRVLEDVAYTPPEEMVNRWHDLTAVFNAAVFGTTDSASWGRERAPRWAWLAGQILAGEIDVGAGTP